MSVTSILKGNDFPEFKTYIKANLPKKSMFVSGTGYPPFSKDIPMQVTGSTESAYETALVGELADYVFYLEIIRFLQNDKLRYFSDLFRPLAQSYQSILHSDPENGEKYQKRYQAVQIACQKYILGGTVKLEDLVECANLLNKVDHYHHVRRQDRDVFWAKFPEPCNKRIVDDVIALTEVFRRSFLEGGYIRKDSVVSFQPWFGGITAPVGKADLYVDGVLYDFKSTKKNGFCWTDVGQVYSYYLLHRLDMKYCRDTVLEQPIPITDVTAIALYYSRYGDVEICSLEKADLCLDDDELRALAELMDDCAHKRREKMRKELMASFADYQFNTMVHERMNSPASVCYTPETIGYSVGDAVYTYKHGRGTVLGFVQTETSWIVTVRLETGQVLKGDINKVIFVKWATVEQEASVFVSDRFFTR